MIISLTFTKRVTAFATKAGLRLLFAIVYVVSSPAHLQTAMAAAMQDSFSFSVIDNESGLPQNSVRAIQVDLDGFLWVGTEKGLSRFDGYRFINFSESIPDIPQDVLLGLQVDSKNRIWMLSYRHSLRILSANRKDVTIIQPAEGYPDDLVESAHDIVELANGDIWFSGWKNIYRLDAANKVTSFQVKSSIRSAGVTWGDLIVYGTMDGLLLLNVETEAIKYINVPAYLDPASQYSGGTLTVTVNDNRFIFCHSTGVFSYSTQTARLVEIQVESNSGIDNCKQLGSSLLISRVKPESGRFKLSTLDMRSREFIPNQAGLPESGLVWNSLGLRDAFVDSSNNKWVLLGDALLQSDGLNGVFRALDFPTMPVDRRHIFAQSDQGVIWVRTDGSGLARFSRYSRRFQTTVPPASVSPSSQVRAMAVDSDDNVWLVNDERRLLFWNRSQDTWVDRLPGNPETVKGLEVLPDGTVWVTIPNLNKVIGFDPKTGSWEHEYRVSKLSVVLSQTPTGQLMLASGNQVITIDPQTGQQNNITKEPLGGQLRAIEQDKDGNTWVGAHEAGLTRVDSLGGLKTWNSKNSALSSDEIFSLHFGSDGLLWIGTWHGGLLSFDPVTEEFQHYGQDDGLPDSTVFGILEDDDGYLWLSTYAGLVRFLPCVREECMPEIFSFNRHDGLQADEFDADSHFISRQGELFFGGGGGFNTFYPQDIRINQQPPRVAISGAYLNDGPLPGIDSEYSFPASIRLPFEFGELRLEVSVLDFNNPIKNRMQYRDSSDGDSWQDMQQPFLSIRGLSDGAHTFQFRGSNNDGVWSTQYAQIKLIVAPPIFRHPLMLVLYLLLVILIPVLYFRRRQEQLIQHQQVLEAEVAKRTNELELANSARERFFANISHEISSPVQMILLMLESHMNDAQAGDKALYKSATAYAAQLMVYLKQLVNEARSHELDSHLYAANLSRIIETLVLTNQPIAKARSVSLSFDPLPAERVALYASSAVSIFSNLLCNALIYTPEGGDIRIKGVVADKFYRFTITNTISASQATDIERFLERGVRGNFDANCFGGHGLGLSIVTNAIEVLGGGIDVSLQGDNNIVFTLDLPLAGESMPELAGEGDLAFSYEQILAIRLVDDDQSQSQDTAKPLNGTTVLVIEDDTLAANLISQSLSQSFVVYVAGTFQEGMRLVRKHQPKAILCDLFLPDHSGFEVLKAIRANRMTMDTFFVMVTASISEEDRLRGQELGVDQFIRKPVSAETLKLLVKNHFELEEQRSDHIQQEKLTRKARIDRVQSTKYPFEVRFIEAIEELYQDPGTTIGDLQTRLSMSYAALMNNCKKTFGKTPKRLLIEKRVEVAKELLKSSQYKVGLIAELAGFSTHSQFAIVFKKETGMTPAAFRKSE